ncbi:HEAT repeat domain-containing protein [Rubrolithibacter danxiaensis]|uniref:HEAT repeat domain-containing protein n=1 Tax=Rubrolithibacter danxiaensis TaxID=3390805 RepID=UPI003BF8E555
MISHVIIYGDDEEADALIEFLLPSFLKIPVRNAGVRKILKKELLTYHANFTGTTQHVLRELYIRLKLDKYARKELKSRFWEKQIEAIRELTQMSVNEEAENILQYANDEIAQLRMEAQAAYVKLSRQDQFRFLEEAKERILDWHQLVLFDVITRTKNIKIPSFVKYLHSKNDSVVLLCLKLINHYQQLEAIPQLIDLLKHKNLAVRSLIIEVLAKMEAEMAEEDLFTIYPQQPLGIQLHILHAFGKIGSGNYLRFLVQESDSENFKIRMHALRAIKDHGAAGKELLNGLYASETVQNKSIIKHVLDERIKV